MGATSGAHTAVGAVMTSLSSRTRDHRPAESELAGIEIVAGAAGAATISRIGLEEEDERQVSAPQPGLGGDSDPLGRSIHLVEGVAQGFVGWPSVGHIDRS